MIQEKYIQVNSPDVIHEFFDDEVILINLEIGNYYSIANVAANIWERIGNGTMVGEIAIGISQAYQGDSKEIEQAVYQFVQDLQQEGLISLMDADESIDVIKTETKGNVGSELQKPDFEVPVLNRYTDMQALLVLDPIHEVNESGWPNPRPNDSDLDV